MLLAAVRAPSAAIAVTVATDLVAYVPTWVNAWKSPGDEVATGYALYAAGAVAALWAVVKAGDPLVFAAVAYPLYLTAADGAATVLILARRRSAVAERSTDEVPSAAPGVLSR
jgi:hypothetical protein